MKLYITTLKISLMLLLTSVQLFAESTDNYKMYTEDYAMMIFNSDVETLTGLLKKDFSKDDFSSRDYSIKKGLILFNLAQKTYATEEKWAKMGYEYWKRTYELPGFQNPIHLAYYGSIEAIWGGAIQSPQPMKKVNLANAGMKKLKIAIADTEKENDSFLLGMVYFLEGNTLAGIPEFFKESKDTPKSLKKAVSLFSKLSKSENYDKKLIYYLISYTYKTYGDYSIKIGAHSKAKKIYKTAKKYLDKQNINGAILDEINENLNKL